MPHEKINHPRQRNHPEDAARKEQLVVGWHHIGWVQVSVYPHGWSDTGDAEHVDLNPQELDLLIKTLRRARRQAYSQGNRHHGFEDGKNITSRPLFPAPEATPLSEEPHTAVSEEFAPCGLHNYDFDDECGWCWVLKTSTLDLESPLASDRRDK